MILTGEQLFFRYAWPCADIRLGKKKMTDGQYALLKFFRDNPHRRPGRKLLMECFPDATRSLSETASAARVYDPWSLEHVTEYWRYCHEGPSPVAIVTVESMGVDRIWGRTENWRLVPLMNPWSLDVKQGDRVTVHNHHAIEKI